MTWWRFASLCYAAVVEFSINTRRCSFRGLKNGCSIWAHYFRTCKRFVRKPLNNIVFCKWYNGVCHNAVGQVPTEVLLCGSCAWSGCQPSSEGGHLGHAHCFFAPSAGSLPSFLMAYAVLNNQCTVVVPMYWVTQSPLTVCRCCFSTRSRGYNH